MPSGNPASSSREERLHAILAAYLTAVEAGQSPDREAVLRQHPDLAPDLRAFFTDHDRMGRAVAGLRVPLAPGPQPPTTPEAAPPPGVIRVRYLGDYELLEELGRGAMGVVYKARQRSLNRLVAVKMILSAQFATSAEVERFRREAQAVAQIDHSGIVPLYEIGEHDGQRYFSMKWINGNNLSQDLPHFRANHRAAAFLLAKVARAVHAAHGRNILHRDLKPGNILLDATKQPHVTDFGLAKRLDATSSLSPAGAAVGTPGYMAPEQAAARTGGLSFAADIYSLGAILYEMLTGQPPFRAATPLETLLQVIEREPPPPSQLNPKIDRDLEIICLKCLDKRPQRRYASAEKLAEDLENWVEGKPIQARRVSRAERAWLWCRRKPVLAALSATAALLLVLLAVAVPISVINEGRRAEADRLKKEADREKEIADQKAREEAERRRQEEDKKRRQEYLGDMRAASLAWRVSDFAEVRRLLEKYRPASKDETDFRGWEWYLFDAGSRGHLATIRVAGGISYLSWSPDGQRMAWRTGDNFVHIWDASTGQELPALDAMGEPYGQTLWAPDNRRLATLDNGNVRIWDTTNGKMLFSLAEPPPPKPNSVLERLWIGWFVWSPDGRFLATSGKSRPGSAIPPGTKQVPVRLWDSATGQEKKVLPGSEGASEVRWSGDGRRLIAFSDAGLKMWDIEQDKELFTLTSSPGNAWDRADWSPDGRRLAVLDNHQSPPSGKITFVDAASGKALATSPEIERFKAWKWSHDGQRLAVVGETTRPVPYGPYGPHLIQVLDAVTGKRLFKLHTDLRSIAWSSDGRRLLTQLPQAPEILAWHATSGEKIAAEEGDGNALARTGFLPIITVYSQFPSPDGRRLAEIVPDTSSSDPLGQQKASLLCVWDMSHGKRVVPNLRQPQTQQKQSFGSPDGKLVAIKQDGTVREAGTGRIVHVLGGISRGAGCGLSPAPETAVFPSPSATTVCDPLWS